MLVHPTAHPTGGSSTVWMLWLDLSLSQFGWGKGSAAEPLPLAELQPAMSRKSTAVMCGLHVYSWCTRIEGMNHDPFGHGGSLKEAGNTIMAQQDPLDGVSRALHSAADGLACTLRGAAEKLNSFSSHAQGVQGAWDACAGALQRGIAQHRSQVAPRPPPLFASIRSSGNGSSNARRGTQGGSPAEGKKATVEEDRVLISEVLIKDKDGGDLDDVELARAAADALKVSKPNAVLTRRDVQDDVHRIIDTGYFASCMPTAEDTRDGVRLIYKVSDHVLHLVTIPLPLLPRNASTYQHSLISASHTFRSCSRGRPHAPKGSNMLNSCVSGEILMHWLFPVHADRAESGDEGAHIQWRQRAAGASDRGRLQERIRYEAPVQSPSVPDACPLSMPKPAPAANLGCPVEKSYAQAAPGVAGDVNRV